MTLRVNIKGIDSGGFLNIGDKQVTYVANANKVFVLSDEYSENKPLVIFSRSVSIQNRDF